MSAPDRLALARGARRAEAMFDEEVDRLVAMSDEDFVHAMEQLEPLALERQRQRQPHGDGGRDVLARARRAAASRGAVPGGRRPSRRTGPALRIAYAAVAAAMAALVASLLIERQAVVTWIHGRDRTIRPDEWRPSPPTPQPTAPALSTQPAPPSPPSPQEVALQQAAGERKDADYFCGIKEWAACLFHLNRARSLDPAGDDTPRIRQMRAVIAKEGPTSPHWNK